MHRPIPSARAVLTAFDTVEATGCDVVVENGVVGNSVADVKCTPTNSLLRIMMREESMSLPAGWRALRATEPATRANSCPS